MAHVTLLAPVSTLMWVVILAMSITPLLTMEALTIMLASPRHPLSQPVCAITTM
jgi:hypothetical protein